MLEEARANLEDLRRNPYPGRGIIVGLDETGEYMIQVYWIMGRSENSRNRVFDHEERRVFTEPADLAKVQDPSLIIYNAMDAMNGYHVVSNGHQTDVALRHLVCGSNLHISVGKYQYEPDRPNFTPRITAVSSWKKGVPMAQISILRKSAQGETCDRCFYTFGEIGRGIGYCVTTYSGDGDPLPSFRGEPYPLPLTGGIDEIGETLWDVLNHENRVSLVVKSIRIGSCRIDIDRRRSGIWIKNKFTKVS